MIVEVLRRGYCISINIDNFKFVSYINELGESSSTYIETKNGSFKFNNLNIINISKGKLLKTIKTLLLL